MSYEELVRKRRQENREMLKSLGILNVRKEIPERSVKKSSKDSVKSAFPGNSIRKPSKMPRLRSSSRNSTPSRKSNRLLGKKAPKYVDIGEVEALISPVRKAKQKYSRNAPILPKEKIKRENVFGAIPDVPVGTEYSTRLEASHAGIHRPTVAGIHGNPALGCYSIALSGGYEDDVDLGESFIYTGEGGRDLKGTKANPKNLRTAAQSKNQVLARGNLALSKNVENGEPVRVLRGYKLNSKFAPDLGYRYDGLYRVKEYYLTQGKSGFAVYKFKFERIEEQEPAPWTDDIGENNDSNSAIYSSKNENDVSSSNMELYEAPPVLEKEVVDSATPPEGEFKSDETMETYDIPLLENENVYQPLLESEVLDLLDDEFESNEVVDSTSSPYDEFESNEVVDSTNSPNDEFESNEVVDSTTSPNDKFESDENMEI